MAEAPTTLTIDDVAYVTLAEYQRVVEEKARAIQSANVLLNTVRDQRNTALDELAMLKATRRQE